MKSLSKKKYRERPEHKKHVILDQKLRRQHVKQKLLNFDYVIEQFNLKVKDGPGYACCVCHRLLFRNQVLCCHKNKYRHREDICLVADKCISEDYLHKCSQGCSGPCNIITTSRGKLWICYTCRNKISIGQVPPECASNNLVLDPSPEDLRCLNSLEQHMIALHIPFIKMLALPKGGQNGVHGPVMCVPANIVQTNNLLPQSNMEGSLLAVNLKRKLTYKGHYEYQFVDTVHIRQALQCLNMSNIHYKDVEFNEDWLNEFCAELNADDDVGNSNEDTGTGDAHISLEDELLHDCQQHCVFQDTCLMAVDIGQEALDQYFDSVLNVAPAEGNNPVTLLNGDGDADVVLDDAWYELCPEQELERLMCLDECGEREQTAEGHEEIPDLSSTMEQVSHLEKRNKTMCRSDGLTLIWSLNDKQMSVFIQIRQW